MPYHPAWEEAKIRGTAQHLQPVMPTKHDMQTNICHRDAQRACRSSGMHSEPKVHMLMLVPVHTVMAAELAQEYIEIVNASAATLCLPPILFVSWASGGFVWLACRSRALCAH